MRWLLLLFACTKPQYVSGSLHCAATGKACPDDFYCGAGGFCWKNGTGPEMGAPDMSLAPDLGVAVDLAATLPDLAATLPDLIGADGAPPSLCPGTFKICDGFEGGSLNGRWSQDFMGGGSITLDTSRAYRGSSSLHFHADAQASAGSTYATLVTFSMLPFTGTAYARAWVYLPADYPGAFNQILNFADASGGGAAFSTDTGVVVANDYAVPNSYAESATAIPTGRWVCLAISLAQGSATGAFKLFVDDLEVSDVSFSSAATPNMTHIYLGLDWNNGAAFPATDLWMDELVIHDQPVSCSQ
jgi:hypothetical protein